MTSRLARNHVYRDHIGRLHREEVIRRLSRVASWLRPLVTQRRLEGYERQRTTAFFYALLQARQRILDCQTGLPPRTAAELEALSYHCAGPLAGFRRHLDEARMAAAAEESLTESPATVG